MDEDRIEHAEKLVAKADALEDRISDQTARVINDLVTYKQRAIKWQIITSIILGLVIIMFVVGTFIIIKIRDNATSITEFCKATNEANAGQIQLWSFLLNIPPEGDESPEDQETKVEFTDLVNRIFAPHNCAQPAVIP